MSYRYDKFDDVLLPANDPAPDLSPGEVDTSLLDSVGAAFNYYGDRQRLPRKQTITMQGKYIGQTEYLVDHEGNYLVDYQASFIVNEADVFIVDQDGNFIMDMADTAGNLLIAGRGPNRLRAQIDALTEKLGQLGYLYRQRLDDDVYQVKQCRLVGVNLPRRVEEVDVIANVTVTFETEKPTWRRVQTTSSQITLGAGQNVLVVHNDGNVVVHDALIAVAASSTITSLQVAKHGGGINWTWAGSLTAGQSLAIDCGAQTVIRGAVDEWNGLTLNSGHTEDGWLPLAKGQTILIITCDGAGTFSVLHDDQWV
jgi:hypothetical protein